MTKERLKRYLDLEKEVRNQKERIAEMKSQELFPTRPESSGSQHQPGAGDGMERAIIRRMEIEDRMQANLDEMEAIQRAIDALNDPQEREVLRLRYIDGDEFGGLMRWRDVTLKLYRRYTEAKKQATMRIHRIAIKHLEEQED